MGSQHVRRGLAALMLMSLTAAACASDANDAVVSTTSTEAPSTPAAPSSSTTSTADEDTDGAEPASTTGDSVPTVEPDLDPASFTVRPSTGEIDIIGAEPEATLSLVDTDGETVQSGDVDAQGSLVFRDVEPGDGWTVVSDTETTDALTVLAPGDDPDASFYRGNTELAEGGFGYITVRDGTTLSANVMLPGPADRGPYPTVVEYSGYAPSNPTDTTFGSIYNALGFAYVGVNVRGTGCSDGSYRAFEPIQSVDGYDVIETVAAQPWVMDHEVGMVGISYPAIMQLYVASTAPPSLNSVSPQSPLDDAYRSTLYPGGILNTGFAVDWTSERVESAEVYGQAWSKDRADAGDEQCATNQQLRLQNPDLLQEIRDNPFYVNPLGDSLSPATFVDRIDVPVFIAGAWQDEQTGGHFSDMIPKFAGSPHVYSTLVNGLHTESILPGVFQRYAEFLQLYVGKEVPDMTTVNSIIPILGKSLSGVDGFPAYESRFAGMTYPAALAAFESEPPVRILFEEGAADGQPAGSPVPRFTVQLFDWPASNAEATTWFLGPDGSLNADSPTVAAAAPGATSKYEADPDALPATFFPGGGSSDIWKAMPTWDWEPLPEGTGVGFVTPVLDEDLVVAGAGSADLWIQSSTLDTDLEVTITEVRPDGQEVYVQSGWLRASQRALDDDASTALHPVHTHTEADAEPLADDGEPQLVRVDMFPFAHAFRAGSRLRLTIDAPGNNRAVWAFDTIANREQVTIAHDRAHPSAIVLPVLAGIDVPRSLPACGSLRGQPCRAYIPTPAEADAP